jgi:transposase
MSRKSTKTPTEVPESIRQEILSLRRLGYGTRRIAPRVGYSRKIVRRVLNESCPPGLLSATSPPPAQASKLDPFQTLLTEKVQKGLTTSRILREIREAGYQGGRTILAERTRQMRITLGSPPQKTVKRRFETPPGQEIQIDWSPYQIPLGGTLCKVHALGCLLCSSRKLFVHFFADDRQSTLLEGLAMAFEYFEGVAQRVVLDNMSTAVLGRLQHDGTVLWHPRFTDFARHYGFVPFPCKPRDPDRKGKKEKSFRLLYCDFLQGSEFSSWEDLNARGRIWRDETPGAGNLRVHGTTQRVPNEAWEEEKPLLIALPERRYAVFEHSVRVVDRDSTISVRGTRYSVPATLANRSVAVRLFAEHFEVLDRDGRLAWSRRYAPADQHGKLIIDPTHYAMLRRRPPTGSERLDQAFLTRFPTLGPLVRGLACKMKSFLGVHLRALLRLADRYGSEHFVAAAEHAQNHRRFDARAVERILQQRHGDGDEPPPAPLGNCGPDLVPDPDAGDLGSYRRFDNASEPDAKSDEESAGETPAPDSNENDRHEDDAVKDDEPTDDDDPTKES